MASQDGEDLVTKTASSSCQAAIGGVDRVAQPIANATDVAAAGIGRFAEWERPVG